MKMSQRCLRALFVALPLFAAQVYAQSLEWTFDGESPFLPVYGTINGSSNIQENPAGVMNFTEVSTGNSFQAFCVEPAVLMSYGDTVTYGIADISELQNSEIIAKLISVYLNSSQGDLDAAAVQWAIWEITNEAASSKSLTEDSGNVYITSDSESVALLANEYLAAASNFTGTPVTLTYLTSDEGQNIVTWQVVPEPGSALLIGLSGVVLLSRRRRA
ncbi:MAG: PEP-CTERM sorting domain-containing protein [Luteolibacter sp.]